MDPYFRTYFTANSFQFVINIIKCSQNLFDNHLFNKGYKQYDVLINSTQQIPKQLTKPHGNSLYLHRLLTNRKGKWNNFVRVTRLDEFTLIVTDLWFDLGFIKRDAGRPKYFTK